mmetsp:Transcript_92603/g.266310  ORF Transcript_92603/g.266310 Transcript_92603/m.266310 type:complete len:233 (-) Transcript_92603:96-794(-)
MLQLDLEQPRGLAPAVGQQGGGLGLLARGGGHVRRFASSGCCGHPLEPLRLVVAAWSTPRSRTPRRRGRAFGRGGHPPAALAAAEYAAARRSGRGRGDAARESLRARRGLQQPGGATGVHRTVVGLLGIVRESRRLGRRAHGRRESASREVARVASQRAPNRGGPPAAAARPGRLARSRRLRPAPAARATAGLEVTRRSLGQVQPQLLEPRACGPLARRSRRQRRGWLGRSR